MSLNLDVRASSLAGDWASGANESVSSVWWNAAIPTGLQRHFLTQHDLALYLFKAQGLCRSEGAQG